MYNSMKRRTTTAYKTKTKKTEPTKTSTNISTYYETKTNVKLFAVYFIFVVLNNSKKLKCTAC